MNILRRLAVACVGAISALGWTAADGVAAEEPSFLTFGAGAFAVFSEDDRAGQFELQYRPDLKLWIFTPMIGANVGTEGSVYGYAGISLDLFFGNRLVVRPSFAPGLFYEGDGRDLGGTLEFRSAVELAYRFDNRARLGVELSHRSNAGIYDRNPGEESLMLFYHLPLGR